MVESPDEGSHASTVEARACGQTCARELLWSHMLFADSVSLMTRWKKVPTTPDMDISSEGVSIDMDARSKCGVMSLF